MDIVTRDGKTLAATNIRIERKTLKALQEVARAEHRSLSQQVRLELELAVKRHDERHDEMVDRFSDEGVDS